MTWKGAQKSSARGGVVNLYALHHRRNPRESAAIRSLFLLSLRGSARNRGNPFFVFTVIARFRKEPRQSCLRGEGTSPSLRGSARNRGNPVPAGRARHCHCEVPQGTAAILAPRGRHVPVIARFRKEPWQSSLRGESTPPSLRGSVRDRGNPVFGNEPHWIASACRLAMTYNGVSQ